MKEIILYRNIGTARLRWRFVVDDFDTIMLEGPVPEEYSSTINPPKVETSPLPRPPVLAKDSQKHHLETLDKRGIKYEVTPEGKINILSIPSKERHISQFLDHMKDYCTDAIPNCDVLRAQMKREIEDAGGVECPQCQLNRIKKKYRDILENVIVSP